MQLVPLCISIPPGMSSIRTAQFTLCDSCSNIQQGNSTHQISASTKKLLTQQPVIWASMLQMERNGPLQCTFQHTELKPISQAGDVHAKGVKSQLKLIPPWGCRQVCSPTSACAAEDGIAVTCPSWEGRHLLHLPASRTGCGSSALLSTLLPLLQSSSQSHMGTLHHSWPLGYAKQVDFTWNRLGSAGMIPSPFSAKQHWAPTVTNNC